MVPFGFDPEGVPSPAPSYSAAPAPKPASTLTFLSLLLEIAKTEKVYAFKCCNCPPSRSIWTN